ncbi:EAL domain-containing protein [Pelomonas sp. APW6]|uniref:EAL domain-containing protein n=1 Tax=Roseateles subflavus TaxID=3053353 RepID=A0ABT7LKI0_9BURK|nr:EAL domain-containing protein [Pelomonas sp. APW6]MDL5032772.1 EAL domain-containing protein [Pelomonas sp. APW6]
MTATVQPVPPSGHLLEQTLEAAGIGVAWVDAQARIERRSTAFEHWVGSARSLLDCVHGLDAAQWHDWFNDLPALRPLTLRRSDGTSLQVEGQLRALDGDGRNGLLALVLTPLDERRERHAIDILQREVLEAVASGRPLQVVMDLLCRRVEALDPSVICSVLAVDREGRVHPLAAPSLPAAFSAAIDGVPIGPQAGSCGTAAWRREPVEVRDIASDWLWEPFRPLATAFGLAACWSTPIFLPDGHVGATFALYYREVRCVAPFHRRTVEACAQLCQLALQHEESQREIERLAYYDSVTGLPNRTLFTDRAQQALQMSLRLEQPSSLLLLDLDRFKTVNDSLGHAAGDEVLREAARRLGSALRDTDTLARLGGDEFVLMLPGCHALDAMHVAQKLHAALAAPVQLASGVHLNLSASIGISTCPDDGQSFEPLLKNADIAMYEAKQAGRNCSRYFLASMNQSLDERLTLESELRQALNTGRLELHFQPKLALADRRMLGMEALLRWPHPTRGWVPPDRFIPVAEECGLINALDAWVLEAACRQLRDWQAEGLQGLNVSVNVSALRFVQDDVAAHVQQQLQRNGLQASQLTLEVTERLMLDESGRPREQLQALDAMGVRLSVDDFGTGYSSLSYLKRLPVSEVKLDKSFVHDLDTDPDDRALASAVISIGQALDLSVVAEGVETEAQRETLLRLGCQIGQGWLFGRPMDPAAMSAWLWQQQGATTARQA